MPELLSYWFAPENGRKMARWVNEQIAAMVHEAPEKLIGLGMVTLQDPEGTVAELEYIMGDLGLAGVEIGSNVNGKPLGNSALEPFFAAAEASNAAIFVHALHPAGQERLIGPPALEQLVAFPCETALSITSLITSGMLDRFPKLKIAFSHGGGAFALTLPRLEYAWQNFPMIKELSLISPANHARHLYYDSLVYDDFALRYLIGKFGIDQLMIGTDYPFAIYDRNPTERIGDLTLSRTDRNKILAENALRFLYGEQVVL